MKYLKNFESFTNETFNTQVSGTKPGYVTHLDKPKYVLDTEIKNVKSGNYSNIILPIGTIIYNLQGGVFAFHPDLEVEYKDIWNSKYGILIRSEQEILNQIEK